MNNEGRDKNTNSNSDNAAPQGIFSTPELTVDTEKIAPTQDANHKARIASFFAETDASKQAQQVQNAMVVPTNYATEDLIINNGEKKKRSILPIIIAIVAVLAVGGGAAAYFLLNKPTQNTETPLTAFNSFKNYLEKGPEEYQQESSDNDTEWFLLNLGEEDLPIAEKNNYITNLLSKYNNFSEIINQRDPDEKTHQFLGTYKNTVDNVVMLVSIDVETEKLVQTYLNDGKEAAYKIIEKTSNRGESVPDLKIATSVLGSYLESQLSILEMYSAHSCLKDGTLDETCEASLLSSGQAYNDVLNAQSSIRRRINQTLETLGHQLENSTAQLETIIKEKYE